MRRRDRAEAHHLQRLLPGSKIVKAPSRRGMRPIRKAFKDLEAGDLDDAGTISHIEHDPFVLDQDALDRHNLPPELLGTWGRHGWIVYTDGLRQSCSEFTRVWVPDKHRTVKR